MRRNIMGTTIDFGPALRHAVLAGGFTRLLTLAVAGTIVAGAIGLAGGAFLGVVLHILPPEPQPGDARSGRIVARTITGGVAGAGVGGFLRWLLDWAGHGAGGMAGGVGVGLMAGVVWYALWGWWETRPRAG
jgi:hypothetical protein